MIGEEDSYLNSFFSHESLKVDENLIMELEKKDNKDIPTENIMCVQKLMVLGLLYCQGDQY